MKEKSPLSARFRSNRRREQTYLLHLMGTLALSLLLLIVLFNLPLRESHRVGWRRVPPYAHLRLKDVRLEQETPQPAHETPVPSLHQPHSSEQSETDPVTSPEAPVDSTRTGQNGGESNYSGGASRLTLRSVKQLPEIKGGIGRYYLNIEYPPEAVEAGIQGRLLLGFVVNEDGSASHIRVLESLHPLCDSAAVRALRRTQFVPGRQDGEKVPVHMRLPVRFTLVDTSAPS